MKKEAIAYTFRMPPKLKKRFDDLSKNLSKPKSVIVREALEKYFKDLESTSFDSSDMEDFSQAIEALKDLKEGSHKKASKKIDKVVKNLQQKSD